MRFILPVVPTLECSPNGHVHHMTKHKAQQQLKTDAGWLLKGQLPEQTITEPVDLHYRVIWPKGRKRMDTDNLIGSLKYCQDALTDAGVWTDDKLVRDIRVEQMSWSEAGRPVEFEASGVMTIDIEPVRVSVTSYSGGLAKPLGAICFDFQEPHEVEEEDYELLRHAAAKVANYCDLFDV